MNIRKAIAACEAQYLSEGGRASTWAGDYLKVLRHLPQDKPLTPHRLRDLVERWEPNSRSRQRACHAAQYLAKFAGVDWTAGKLKGRYKARPVDPRRIPTDEEIEAQFDRLENADWRWVYGSIAAYGLRPHEALRCDLEKFKQGDGKCWVPHETKTGARRVWPLHPEWFYSFRLQQSRRPPINLARDNSAIGHAATEYFSRTARLPFNLYSLRHAWARRAYLEGLDDAAAAKMMGHSLDVHQTIYRAWFDDLVLERAYQDMLAKRQPRKQ